MSEAQTIAIYQPLLQAIAMNILGSKRDAEDLVQDTLLKWLSGGPQKIENTRAYLVQAVRNNALKYKQAFHQKKIELMDQIPEAMASRFHINLDHIDLDHELKRAADILHHKLEPLEKGVFILREIFQLEYEDIQQVFEKRKDHCRQLLSRARKKLSSDSGDVMPQGDSVSLWQHIKKAIHNDQLADLILHLKEENK